ncbi:MAG: TonB-dependent receptor [Lysobacterales bacterium]|jgi:iron complex outermembrane receptor protein
MQIVQQSKSGRFNRLRLPLALCAALLSAVALPATAFAQAGEDDEASAGLLEEVIVTAQRREQPLQDVPMSVSAFNGEQLAQLQADNLTALQGAVPNLNLVQGRGSNSSVNAFIRGVGQPDALQTFDPAVGIYLDDVYMSRIQGAMFKLYDIERVEVLRGPQGTLYGKNTPGGAIRLITRTPGDTFEAQAGLTVGNFSRVEAKGYIAGPVTDNFSLGFSALHNERDGFVTDPTDGRKYNDENSTVARMKGVWTANDAVTVEFSADYTHEDVALTLGRAEADLTSWDLGTGEYPVLLPAPTGDWNWETRTSLGDAGGQKVDHWGGNLTVSWDINDSTRLKSITAYRDLQADLYIDIDATELQLGDVFVGIDQNQFSQEFQLLGNNGDDIDWVAGLYYLKEKVPSHQEAYADDFLKYYGLPIAFLRTIDDDLQTTSYAAFGQVDWRFADRWSLGVGMRYTNEKKDYFRTTSTFTDLLGNADPAFAFDDSASWDSWTPTVTLDYDLNDDVRLYGRVAKGFKSGGFNGRANSPADVSTFDPETVWTGEIGAKTTMADGRLVANYALFMSKYDDFQARVSVADGIDFRFPVLNAAKLDIKGAEAELTWLPIDALQLSTQIGYLDAKYGAGGFSGSDKIPDEPAFSPEWTARLFGMYTVDLSGRGSISLGASGNYRDSMWLSVDNLDTLSEGSYWVLDGFVTWTGPEQHWSVTAGVKNATDELYKVEGQEFRSVGNIQTAYYGDPRTYMLSVEFKY